MEVQKAVGTEYGILVSGSFFLVAHLFSFLFLNMFFFFNYFRERKGEAERKRKISVRA